LSSARSTSSSDVHTTPVPERGAVARWLPVLLWAAVIGWFSGDAFSARSTHNYIDPVIRFFFGDLSPEGFRFAHAVVRKTAHFVEYAVLAFLMVRALAPYPAPVGLAVVGRAIVLSALYAGADELHQWFVPTRGGSPVDVALDTLGAGFGALLMYWRRGGS
jgi:VanZ family protein